MAVKIPDDMRQAGRAYGATFVFFALVLAGMESKLTSTTGSFGITSVLVAPAFLALGVAGLIQPGLFWSLSARRTELPAWMRWMGLALAALVAALALGGVWVLKGGRL